jgi:hypothetical protein
VRPSIYCGLPDLRNPLKSPKESLKARVWRPLRRLRS